MKASFPQHGAPSTNFDRWLYALKPASWPKLLVPTLLGQMIGAASVGSLNGVAVLCGLAFTVFGIGFIVLINDWGDRRVDGIKREMFPQAGSPKTIPDQILSAQSVAVVGLVLGVLTFGVAGAAEVVLRRPLAIEAGIACIAVFAAYTLPPVRLNYRGGGELLEMIGVGVALPLFNVYLQAGRIGAGVWPWLAGFAFLSLGSGIASGLSDEQSDREGGKRTVASILGNLTARRMTEASVVVGALIWCGATLAGSDAMPRWVMLPALGLVALRFYQLSRLSASAVTNAFAAQGVYKQRLHEAIWHGTTVASLLLWLHIIIP